MLFGQSANSNDFAATSRNEREKKSASHLVLHCPTNINHMIISNTETFHRASFQFILIKTFFDYYSSKLKSETDASGLAHGEN